jgi:hypothetical protein
MPEFLHPQWETESRAVQVLTQLGEVRKRLQLGQKQKG